MIYRSQSLQLMHADPAGSPKSNDERKGKI